MTVRFLDLGLDEMAAGARAGFGARLFATAGVGLIALAFLPWPVCLAWTLGVGGVDILSWFVSKEQAEKQEGRGEVSWRARVAHLTCLVTAIAGWVALGELLWARNTAASDLCAVVIWLAMMGFAQVHAYQSRVGYLVAGVIPAAALLITPLASRNTALSPMPAVWAMLLLSVAFAASSARQTMAARRRYDQAIQDLRDSEQSYRILADNVTDVISLASPEGERIYVSPSIERVMGFAPGELLQTPNYRYLHEDDAEAVQAFIKATTAETGPRTMTYRVFAKGGAVIWAETTFSRLNDGSGRVLAVSRDITQRKALESELKDALARAEAAAAAKTDFLANMTHELRTPLTAIVGFAQVLRQSRSLGKRDARHAGLIEDASRTLLGVIGDVLDFSKLEAGAFELDPQPFDPAETARSAAAIVAEQAEAKGLTLVARVEAEAPAVLGDAPRLRQVMLNFLSNAIKFTRQGDLAIGLTHMVEDETCRLRVEVRDSGIGIEAAQIEGLFSRFTQADASVSRRFGGTGLGLAISKQIIDAMGGRIGALSRLGEGSTFWFEVDLPLARGWTGSSEPEAAGAGLDRPIRVLLVEDNAVNRELIATLLGPFAIELDTACDGAEAVEAVGRRRYDVILMDMQMPVMDGLTATRRIRGLPDRAAAATPIVAMTANVLPEQVARCHEAGMNDHIGKPINLPRLLQALERWSAEGGDGAGAEADAIAS